MSLTALLFVAASSPQAQAILTTTEAHYRGLAALRTQVTITVAPPARLGPGHPTPYGGTLVLQNPGMLSFQTDPGAPDVNVAIDGLRIRSTTRPANPSVPTLVRVFALTSSSAESDMWTWLAALFVGKRALSEKCDFEVRAANSRSTTLSGKPLEPGWWSRIDVEVDPNSEVRSVTFRAATSGVETTVAFGHFAVVLPPGRGAFSTKVPVDP